MHLSRSIAVMSLAAVCTALFSLSPAAADWSDDFNGGLNPNLSWEFSNLKGDFSGSSATFTAGTAGDVLELTDPTTAAAGGAALGFGFVTDEVFDHVRVAGTINPLGESNADWQNNNIPVNWEIGLVARAQPATVSAYALTVDLVAQSLDLTLAQGQNQSELAAADIPGLAPDASVYLWFGLDGSTLIGRAYDAPGGNLLAEVAANDSTLTSGLSGVVVAAASEGTYQGNSLFAPLRGTFDDVSSTVPEPASMILLLLGGAAVAGLAIRRRV